MSATRVLILSYVRALQPVHGYDVRRALVDSHAQNWGNIAPGSVYHALTTMERDGLLETVGTESRGNRPARTTYTVTEKGEAEFQRLLRGLWYADDQPADPFQIALSTMAELSQDELLAALRHRLTTVRGRADEVESFADSGPTLLGKPRHVSTMMRLSVARLRAEVDWLEDTIAAVERGEVP